MLTKKEICINQINIVEIIASNYRNLRISALLKFIVRNFLMLISIWIASSISRDTYSVFIYRIRMYYISTARFRDSTCFRRACLGAVVDKYNFCHGLH